MKVSPKVFGQLAQAVLDQGAKKATKFISDNLTVRATLRSKPRKNGRATILFTVGGPNYRERQFIRKCKKAGETLPVKIIQLKWPS